MGKHGLGVLRGLVDGGIRLLKLDLGRAKDGNGIPDLGLGGRLPTLKLKDSLLKTARPLDFLGGGDEVLELVGESKHLIACATEAHTMIPFAKTVTTTEVVASGAVMTGLIQRVASETASRSEAVLVMSLPCGSVRRW